MNITETISIEADLLLKLRALPEADIFEFMKNLRGGTYFNMGMYSSIPVARAYKSTIRIYKVQNLTAIVSGIDYENIKTTKEYRDSTGEGPGHIWYDHTPGFEHKVGQKKKDPNSKYVLWDIKKCTDTWVRYYVVDIETGSVTPVSKQDILNSDYLTQTEKNKLEPKHVTGIDLATGQVVENKTNWRTTAFEHIFWLNQAGKATQEYGVKFMENFELKEATSADVFIDGNAHVKTKLDDILSGNIIESTNLQEDNNTTSIRCMHALYEDSNGYVCNVGVFAGDLDEEELEEILSESGCMYILLWDEYERNISTSIAANCKPGEVIEVFEVSDDDIEDIASISGKDPDEYRHVGFFEGTTSIQGKYTLKEYVDKPERNQAVEQACKIIGCKFAELEYKSSDEEFANNPTYTKQANSNDIAGYENKVRNMRTCTELNNTAPDIEYYRDYDLGIDVVAHFDYSDSGKSKIVLIPTRKMVESLEEAVLNDLYTALHTPGVWGIEFVGDECICFSSEKEARAYFKKLTHNNIYSDSEGIELFKVLDTDGNTETVEVISVYDDYIDESYKNKSLSESCRRIVSRGNSLVDNELFIDFE